MKRRYIVIKEFKNGGKTYSVGSVIPHRELKDIPRESIYKNVYIQDYNDIQLVINPGLIFKSTEYPFRQYYEEETLEAMEERLKCEMNNCCPGSNKKYLKDKH